MDTDKRGDPITLAYSAQRDPLRDCPHCGARVQTWFTRMGLKTGVPVVCERCFSPYTVVRDMEGYFKLLNLLAAILSLVALYLLIRKAVHFAAITFVAAQFLMYTGIILRNRHSRLEQLPSNSASLNTSKGK